MFDQVHNFKQQIFKRPSQRASLLTRMSFSWTVSSILLCVCGAISDVGSRKVQYWLLESDSALRGSLDLYAGAV